MLLGYATTFILILGAIVNSFRNFTLLFKYSINIILKISLCLLLIAFQILVTADYYFELIITSLFKMHSLQFSIGVKL